MWKFGRHLRRTFPFLVTADAGDDETLFFLKGTRWEGQPGAEPMGWPHGCGASAVFSSVH